MAGKQWTRGLVGVWLFGLFTVSCGEIVCTTEGIFAIAVVVEDSATGGQITSTPIGIVTHGEGQDTLYASRKHILRGGPTHAGTYDVEVWAEGYQVWRRENVVVRKSGRCSKVETVVLTARMVTTGRG